jgi:hypothetical protein
MEIVIEHPQEFHAYRIGYDSPKSIANAVGERVLAQRNPPRFMIMTKTGPKEALLGDYIIKRGPTEFDVCTASEFHMKYIFKRAVSGNRRIHRSSKPRVKWDDYLRPEEEDPTLLARPKRGPGRPKKKKT